MTTMNLKLRYIISPLSIGANAVLKPILDVATDPEPGQRAAGRPAVPGSEWFLLLEVENREDCRVCGGHALNYTPATTSTLQTSWEALCEGDTGLILIFQDDPKSRKATFCQ